jgi:ketosteroid isomerase-like protein
MKVNYIFLLIFSLSIFCFSQSAQNFLGDNMNTKESLEIVNKFNEAFNSHDVDQIMSLMTGDCIFENTRPSPDGERFEGQIAIRKVWEEMFIRSPKARFVTEEIFAFGDRCIVRWIYHWIKEGKEGHVRGVDIIRVRDGKIAEKFSYVKG